MKKTVNVTAAIIEKENKYLIGKRRRKGSFPGMWEFPGGKIEDGESKEECICRELREECGIETVVIDFFESGYFEDEKKVINLFGYRVEHVSGEYQSKYHQEIRWVYAHEFDNYKFAPADVSIVEKLKKLNHRG